MRMCFFFFYFSAVNLSWLWFFTLFDLQPNIREGNAVVKRDPTVSCSIGMNVICNSTILIKLIQQWRHFLMRHRSKINVPVHAMKLYRWNRGIPPFIFNLGTRWRWMTNSKPRLIFFREIRQPRFRSCTCICYFLLYCDVDSLSVGLALTFSFIPCIYMRTEILGAWGDLKI